MNTADLIERVAAEHGVAKEHAKKILDSAFAAIVAALENGDDVALAGFGRFKLSSRAARQGRNPAPARRSKFPLPGSSPSAPPRASAAPSIRTNSALRSRGSHSLRPEPIAK